MELGAAAPIDPFKIAAHLGVEVRQADELVGRHRLKELRRIQPDAFSAATFRMSSGKTVVVLNPLSSAGRMNSDLAHELSHLVLDHSLDPDWARAAQISLAKRARRSYRRGKRLLLLKQPAGGL
jgi:hypothetical protein